MSPQAREAGNAIPALKCYACLRVVQVKIGAKATLDDAIQVCQTCAVTCAVAAVARAVDPSHACLVSSKHMPSCH